MSKSYDPYKWIDKSLTTIRKANWYRSVQSIQSRPGTIVQLEGQSVINFASNDYLGLAGDQRLIDAAVQATQEYGTGSTGSRLLSGHRDLHRELEQALATLKQTEDAIVFSSGYLANLGTITALVSPRDLILSDQYNHSSLKNGAKLSGATVLEYDHGNVVDLQQKLEEKRHHYRRCLILTDSVFSMDGDLCPLPQLVDLAQTFNSMLLLDEAHGTGVMGKTGAGCVEHFGCTGQPLIQMGTLSKALGSLGGYVAGSSSLIDFLRNRASTWIYTTGLSPGDTAAALAALKIVRTEPQRRTTLWRNIQSLQPKLAKTPYKASILPSESPIICLELKKSSEALTLAEKLKKAGIFAPAIRPPTVPTSRLRFSVMATHTPEQIQKLVTALLN